MARTWGAGDAMVEYRPMTEVLDVQLAEGPYGEESDPQIHSASQRRELPAPNGNALWGRTVTLRVQAPSSWWKQAAHYFPDILWLRSRPEEPDDQRRLRQEDFEHPVPEKFLAHLNQLAQEQRRSTLAAQMPGSFLRQALVHTNLETVATILHERGHYRHGHWYLFCDAIRTIDALRPFLNPPKEATP